jgi:hypothetical protein
MPKPARRSTRRRTAGAIRPLALAAPAKRVIIGIKVHFVLNTRDGLRRVIFGLEKDTQGDVVKWIINFQLFERAKKSDDFGDAIVDVSVEVDTRLNQKADATAQKKSLSPGQSAHALGPAADDAKAANDGEIPQDEANGTIQDTLNKK